MVAGNKRKKMFNISKTSNPVLKERVFHDERVSTDTMTVNGTINKTAIMLLLVVAAAVFTWNKFFDAAVINPESALGAVGPWLLVGGIGGFITVLVTVFRPKSLICD